MVARAGAAACVAALALSAAPHVAEAAPVLHIEWPTLPGCPSSSVVLERARVAISRSRGVEDVHAVVEITPPPTEGGAWQLHIRTRTVRGAGERTLEAPSCDAVARAAAVIVGIASVHTRAPSEPALDELAPAPDRVEEPGPLAVPLSPLKPLPRRETTMAASAKEADARFVPSAGLGIAIGLLPRVAPAASVTLGYERSWLRAHLAFRALLPQDEIERGIGVELGAFGVSFDVCSRLPLPVILRAKTHVCGGAAVDDIHARGVGGIEAFEVRRAALMAFGGVGAAWEVGHAFRIGADARAGGSVVRPMFMSDSVSDGHRLLHRPALVRAECSLTFGMVF
ncbi:MAG: hypothetical protein K0S65_4271 [Labilithrix sp.]|nr:hypothetical protein [Labilithrix sp.]